MRSPHVQLAACSRLGMAAVLCLSLVVGCSGRGSPTSPALEGSSPTADSLQSPETCGGAEAGGPLQTRDSGNRPAYVENELLLVLNESPTKTDVSALLTGWPLKLKKAIPCRWATVYELVITDGSAVDEMVRRLKQYPEVRFAEPNHIYYYAETPYRPNDPLWESDDPGNDPRDCIYDQWGPAKIGASIVWNEGKGSEEVVIAVIDTGVRKDHEDLGEILWINEDEIPDNEIDDDENGYVDDTWGWDMGDGDNDPWDEGYAGNYHGTACSGVAAAIQDNEVGLTGVAPGIHIMALKTSFDSVWESHAVEAVNYAVENGADIISMSFGGAVDSDIFHEALDNAWDDGNGLNLLGCAQNYNSTTPHYPAAYTSVMSIGAAIPFAESGEPIDEKRITYGEDGYYWGSNYGDWLTVMGYGDKYMTTSGSCPDCYYDGVHADFFGGTSCATPMSAGVMALIHSFHPGKTAQWYWDRLQDTADDLDEPGFDIQTGYGRCNALRAVFGSDRYSDQEDPLGFVTLSLPDAQVFDTLHDAPGSPYHDTEDLYRFTTVEEGYLAIELDIFTWGEDLDIALYSDEAMTELLQEATGPNHAGSSTEAVSVNALPGEEYFLRVYSPAPGNSSTYGLRVFNTTNDLSITGESIAPDFIHHQGQNIPFLKLTLEVGYQATLDEMIINKRETLPNHKWAMARLYRDVNSNDELDQFDELVAEKFPQARNRVRLDDLNISWDYHDSLVLFFTADIAETLDDATVSFTLESYKDVSTMQGVQAHYSDFPIVSGSLLVGTDADPPEWVTTEGVQTAEGSYLSAIIGWNGAVDLLTPPVKYNVYYTDTLPFDFGSATKLPDVAASAGTETDYRFKVGGLPADEEQHFVVRAEDQAGNEDENLVMMSCTPSSTGDPTNPTLLERYPLYSPMDITLRDDVLLVADSYDGLKVFDRTDPVYLEEIAAWTDDYTVYSLYFDGTYAYCGGYDYFSAVDLTNPSEPVTADQSSFWDAMALDAEGDWAYAANYWGGLQPFDISDPYNILPGTPAALPPGGWPSELDIAGDYMYLADRYVGIVVLDRSDPAAPSAVNSFGNTNVTSVLATGDVLLTLTWSDGALTSYDIGSNPVSPPILDTTTDGPGSSGAHVVVLGDYAYVSGQSYGLVVYDISDPSNLEYVGNLLLYGARKMATDGALIYVTSIDSSSDGWLNVVI